jgi:hypothetical protein
VEINKWLLKVCLCFSDFLLLLKFSVSISLTNCAISTSGLDCFTPNKIYLTPFILQNEISGLMNNLAIGSTHADAAAVLFLLLTS